MDEDSNPFVQMRHERTKRLRETMPMSVETLKELLSFLGRSDAPECDHTLKEAAEFIKARNLDGEKITQWLHQNGCHCDCEVIYNVYDAVGDIVGWHLSEAN